MTNYFRFNRILYFIYLLVGVSVFLSYFLSIFLNDIGLMIPFYLNLPISAPGIFFLLFGLYNNYLWKWRVFALLGFAPNFDLNGEWVGYINSSGDNFKKKVKARFLITQTATRIKLKGGFENSESISLHESLSFSYIDQSLALYYFYQAIPIVDSKIPFVAHEGAGKFVYDKEKDELKGYYYSGRGDNDFGSIKLERV